jgi:hypothetical protein
LNQSLEKIVIIGLNLTLLVTIGVPLLFTTTQVLTQSEQLIAFQDFVQGTDQSILTADQTRSYLTTQLYVPNNVTLETVHNQLIFKIYLGEWHVITKTYRCPLYIISPIDSGTHQLSVNATESLILVTFEPL